MARALVHGEIVVEVASQKGVKITVDGSGLRESSSFHDIQVEASRKLQKRDENMDSAEKVVYSSFLVGAAREAGKVTEDECGDEGPVCSGERTMSRL